VTASGVAVGVPVPHRVLAQLVGARRPTVSTALSRLAESGELTRDRNGGWLLTGAPVGMPTEEAARIIRVRRHRVVEQRDPEPLERNGLPPTGRIAELIDELAALRAASERRRADTAALTAETRELFERLNENRANRQAGRERD
jgi:DNA-binding GntR family transcriptional regulator